MKQDPKLTPVHPREYLMAPGKGCMLILLGHLSGKTFLVVVDAFTQVARSSSDGPAQLMRQQWTSYITYLLGGEYLNNL